MLLARQSFMILKMILVMDSERISWESIVIKNDLVKKCLKEKNLRNEDIVCRKYTFYSFYYSLEKNNDKRPCFVKINIFIL